LPSIPWAVTYVIVGLTTFPPASALLTFVSHGRRNIGGDDTPK